MDNADNIQKVNEQLYIGSKPVFSTNIYKGVIPPRKYVAVKKLKISEHSDLEKITLIEKNVGDLNKVTFEDCNSDQVYNSEIELLQQLSHPNIIHFHKLHFTATRAYIVMELCPENLEGYLNSRTTEDTRLSQEEKVGLLRQIGEGLKYLHGLANPIIHRDLKTSNILVKYVRDKPCLKLADFGISRQYTFERGHHTTKEPKSPYDIRAPEEYEQWDEKDNSGTTSSGKTSIQITTAVDIFAFGCLIQRMLARDPDKRHPFGKPMNFNDMKTNAKNGKRIHFIFDSRNLESPLIDTFGDCAVDDATKLNPKDRPKINVLLKHPLFWEEGSFNTFLFHTNRLFEELNIKDSAYTSENIFEDLNIYLKKCYRDQISNTDGSATEPAQDSWRWYKCNQDIYNFFKCREKEGRVDDDQGKEFQYLLRFIRNISEHYREVSETYAVRSIKKRKGSFEVSEGEFKSIKRLLGSSVTEFQSNMWKIYPWFMVKLFETYRNFVRKIDGDLAYPFFNLDNLDNIEKVNEQLYIGINPVFSTNIYNGVIPPRNYVAVKVLKISEHPDLKKMSSIEENVGNLNEVNFEDCSSDQVYNSEFKLLRQLSHPNIIRFHKPHFNATHAYIVMEWCPENLEDYLNANTTEDTRLSQEEKVGLLRQIGEGLKYLHGLANPIIHRDLKTSNILVKYVRDKPCLKLADFGISRQYTFERGHHTTKEPKSPYDIRAPEEYEHWDEKDNTGTTSSGKSSIQITTAVDIFAFGCLIQRILARDPDKTHPFGKPLNFNDIKNNAKNQRRINFIFNSEKLESPLIDTFGDCAVDDATKLNPDDRPEIDVLLRHPLFWDEVDFETYLFRTNKFCNKFNHDMIIIKNHTYYFEDIFEDFNRNLKNRYKYQIKNTDGSADPKCKPDRDSWRWYKYNEDIYNFFKCRMKEGKVEDDHGKQFQYLLRFIRNISEDYGTVSKTYAVNSVKDGKKSFEVSEEQFANIKSLLGCSATEFQLNMWKIYPYFVVYLFKTYRKGVQRGKIKTDLAHPYFYSFVSA